MNRDAILSRFGSPWLGRVLECHDELPSTNDRARALLDEMGALAHGAVVLADRQTAGRGRLGRAWHAAPGLGLALSVALCPPSWPEDPAGLPLAGALAVALAAERACGLACSLKWPNDVLVGRRKIAGVLMEGRYLGDKPSGVVLGIGVNLNQRPEDFPGSLHATATSVLMETRRRAEPESFAPVLLGDLEPLLELALQGPQTLTALAGARWTHQPGDLLHVEWAGGSARGAFRRVREDGALELQCPGGVRVFRHGDVTRVRPAP